MGTAPPTDDLADLVRQLRKLSPEARERLLGGGDDQCRERFLPFVRKVWPEFIHGRHHDIMSDAFERIEKGELKRCIINLPPRHSKSKFSSVLFPAWYLGHHPDHKVMECSHTVNLAQGFGRELRNLVVTP